MILASFVAELPSMTLAVAAKGALIAGAALGLAAALRRAPAAVRHLVLALAAMALLALRFLLAFLPSWDLALLPLTPGPSPTPSPQPGEGSTIAASFTPLPGGEGLLLLPLAVSLLLLSRLGLAVHRLARLRASSRPAPPELQNLVDEHRHGIGRPVRPAVSGSVAVPVTFGWRRPRSMTVAPATQACETSPPIVANR